MTRKPKKIHYIYKTTCSLTKRFYIGMHSSDNLDDNYLGSGSELSKSIKKYGREYHSKEILEYLDDRKDLKAREKELITEDLIKDPMCMNLAKGGGGSNYACDLITVIDKDGNTFSCHRDDPRFLNGEVTHHLKKQITVIDKNGNTFNCNNNDPRYLTGEIIALTKNKILVKDKDGKIFRSDINDPKYLSGEFISIHKGTVLVKDKDMEIFRCDINDPKYLSGELKFHWTEKKHSNETKKKMSISQQGKQKGELNSQYGKRWITNGKENKKIFKVDNIPDGWRLGRVMNKKKQV